MDANHWHRLAWQDRAPLAAPSSALQSRDGQERDQAIAGLAESLGSMVLPYPPAISLGSALTRLVDGNRFSPAGSKSIAGVSAPFATGKSTSVTEWAFGRYREWVADVSNRSFPTWQPEQGITARLIPVVYLSLFSSAGVKELNAQILTFLGYPGEGIARVTSARVNTALRRHGVRLLIVDDVHMLRLTERSGRQVLDYLKTLNSELGFLHGTMIFVGPDLAAAPIFEDPQIRSRLRIHDLTPPEIASVEGRRRWQAFLCGCEEILLPYLPGAQEGVLSRQHAGFIWHRTQGFIGDTSALLIGAVIEALRCGRRTITHQDLAAVPLSARAHDQQASLEHRRGRTRAS